VRLIIPWIVTSIHNATVIPQRSRSTNRDDSAVKAETPHMLMYLHEPVISRTAFLIPPNRIPVIMHAYYQLNLQEYCSLYSDSLWVGRFEVRIPVGERYFLFPTPVQTGPEVHTAPTAIHIGAVPLGTKATGWWG